jgi:hypothetical protein
MVFRNGLAALDPDVTLKSPKRLGFWQTPTKTRSRRRQIRACKQTHVVYETRQTDLAPSLNIRPPCHRPKRLAPIETPTISSQCHRVLLKRKASTRGTSAATVTASGACRKCRRSLSPPSSTVSGFFPVSLFGCGPGAARLLCRPSIILSCIRGQRARRTMSVRFVAVAPGISAAEESWSMRKAISTGQKSAHARSRDTSRNSESGPCIGCCAPRRPSSSLGLPSPSPRPVHRRCDHLYDLVLRTRQDSAPP